MMRVGGCQDLLQFDPAAVKAVIEEQSCQVSHAHVPHSGAGREDQNKKIFLSEPDVTGNHLDVSPQKEFVDCTQESASQYQPDQVHPKPKYKEQGYQGEQNGKDIY
jgi:hypothetical protein